ncbi:Flagellar motor switch protein FliM [Aquicella siphonis]|uniref:Flagellar motor switch protein FliM n=1 Tax=Aquicella siphonis TaxID=254247 RepID=A0A5E4PKY8_9COXI|nr:FliM/FliN family flagellar motor switch protein [Aquicella siphonis]VVC77081.1 Flagellar motor switch protein FliM [Aquicella siphonis]
MSDQVLSSEEVDAILKVTQEKQQDLSKIVGEGDASKQEKGKHYTYALTNINEILRTEFEKDITSFLRKRAILKTKTFQLTQVSEVFKNQTDKYIYSIFRLSPNEYYGMVCVDMPLLDQTINLLYGGKLNSKEQMRENPGKIGIIIAEKIAQMCLASFATAGHEYGAVNHEIIKTTASTNLATNLGLNEDDQIYLMELSIFFDEIETTLKLMIAEDFLMQFIPVKAEGHRHREKDFWRTAIKSQVVDSIVTINVSLPDVSMKVKDFMALKDGDLVPIGDPTVVYVCLNNLKLFRATAGQANSKRVAKIINQI